MDLPKLRKTVKIKFLSLRNGVGYNLGVIYDIDTEIERECYRVKDGDSWKWQIKDLKKLALWDYFAETDQEILDEYGSDIDVEYLEEKVIKVIDRQIEMAAKFI